MLKNIKDWSLVLIIVAIISLFGNWLGYNIMPIDAIPGMITLVLVALTGFIIQQLLPINIPAIAYIGVLGLIITTPIFPGSEKVSEWTSKVELLALTTPILAYAGISIGNSWNSFIKIGWRAIIVGSVVLLGTYLGSAVISEIVLRIQGVI